MKNFLVSHDTATVMLIMFIMFRFFIRLFLFKVKTEKCRIYI